MKNDITELYNDVKKVITPSRLKEISIEIINKFKKKDGVYLLKLAEMTGIKADNKNINRLFGKLIQIYHPDKLTLIHNDLDSFYEKGRYEELQRYKNIYFIDLKSIYTAVDYSYIDNQQFEYGEEDFGYSEHEFHEFDYAEFDEESFEDISADKSGSYHERGFFEAVNKLFMGNLDLTITVSDLADLDGELDLSDFEIDDISGIECCVNISILNLSGNNIIKVNRISSLTRLKSLYLSQNHIEDIRDLGSLYQLRDLDLSFNYIDDISVLLELPDLTYVNIVNNPISGKDPVIKKLIKKGVIVIY